ncbi:uncharacterized protein LOC6045416 [Culex quinquefasciatus]|uniref:uncharacterized protein LOC6045416 n=1 Tax=Culex quinquefasciatus TaxID=7176 RepID=UPI0018E37BF4|nr:uncharacterized protein LOC6045416 [Culex quinquefasciatus]
MDELDVKPNIKVEAVDWSEPPANFHHPEVPVALPDQKPNISNFSFPSVVKEELILEDDTPPFEPASGVPDGPEPVTPGLNQYASAEQDSNGPSSDITPGKFACTICQLSFPKSAIYSGTSGKNISSCISATPAIRVSTSRAV